MTEPSKTTDGQAPVLLRLALDRAHVTPWRQLDPQSPYRLHERTYYYDQGAGTRQVYLVTAQVGYLVGSEHAWRYSVGLKIRTGAAEGEGPEFLNGFTLGYGDLDDEDEAKRLADTCALAYLDAPHVPAPAAPIPNLDLVTPAIEGTGPVDFIKRRLPLVREVAERIFDDDFAMDDAMRAVIARVGDDMVYLLEALEETLAWGTETAQELDRVQAELAAGDASDGHHTHNQLYEQRLLYHAHLAQRWFADGTPIVKSTRHHTGEECFGGGWFIVVMQLATGQVSQHYPLWAWDLFRVESQELAPEWDGHTPEMGAKRLRDAITLFPPTLGRMQRRCSDPEPHEGHYYSGSLVFWCATVAPTLEGP